jgi:hypothetical protein
MARKLENCVATCDEAASPAATGSIVFMIQR